MDTLTNLECVITQLHGKGGRAIRVDTMDQVYLSRSLCQLLIALDYQERDRIDLDVSPNANKENKYVPWVAMHLAKKENTLKPATYAPEPEPEPQPTAMAEQFCGILEAKQQEMVLEKDEPKWGSCSREKVEQALRDLHGFGSTTEIMEEVGLKATANVRTHLENMYRAGEILKISVTRYGKSAGRTYWAKDYRSIDEALMYEKND